MSAWITFVKAYRKKNGGSYRDALKKAGPLYRASKKGKAAAPAAEPAKKKRRRKRKKAEA